MAVIDRVRRFGAKGKRVMTGPAELVGPSASGLKAKFSSLVGNYGTVDLYEITDGAGTNAGSYTVALKPYSENGFTQSHRGISEVLVIRQPAGIAAPTNAAACLSRKKPANGAAALTQGPFTVQNGDRLWVMVERRDTTATKYQLEIDFA